MYIICVPIFNFFNVNIPISIHYDINLCKNALTENALKYK